MHIHTHIHTYTYTLIHITTLIQRKPIQIYKIVCKLFRDYPHPDPASRSNQSRDH